MPISVKVQSPNVRYEAESIKSKFSYESSVVYESEGHVRVIVFNPILYFNCYS